MAVERGTSGNDTLVGTGGGDTLYGLGGDDELRGLGGADSLVGGEGLDLLDYRESDAGVSVNLATGEGSGGHAEGDTLSGFEAVRGSDHDDTLVGDGGDNWLRGRAGADSLDGGGGHDWLDYRGSDAGVSVDLATGEVSGGHAEGDTLSGFEAVRGSDHDDTLVGDGDNNSLRGWAGADSLDGGGGHDWLDYRGSDAGVSVNLATGEGSGGHAEGDTLSGFENVRGSDHDDTLVGDGGDNWLRGRAGADSLDGGGGNDYVSYRESDAGVSVNLATGEGSGGHAQGDTISGVERIEGSHHSDTLVGDDGVNSFRGRGGADAIDGGGGLDWASYSSSSSAVHVNLAAGSASGGDAEGDTFRNVEAIFGSRYGDTLIGSGGDNRLDGFWGDDVLTGGRGADTFLFGYFARAHGADTITDFTDGEDRIDLITGFGETTPGFAELRAAAAGIEGGVRLDLSAFGGGTIDVMGITLPELDASDFVLSREPAPNPNPPSGFDSVQSGTDGEDVLTGGSGRDSLSGGSGGDVLLGRGGADRLEGGAGEDVLRGHEGNDTLSGGGGRDVFYGGLGDDSIDGGAGNDFVFAGWGNDTVRAGAGSDWVEGGDGDDTLYGGEGGTDILSGQAGNDRLVGEGGNDRLWGGGGNDTLLGGGGNDSALAGNDGNDSIDGGVGNDTLMGGNGNDTLIGGAGNDLLMGGGWRDTLTGGSGDDVFRFNSWERGRDVIRDYGNGDDVIELNLPKGNTGGGLSFRAEGGGTLITGNGFEILVQGPDAAGLGLSDVDVV